MTPARFACTAVALVTLAACGGGGAAAPSGPGATVTRAAAGSKLDLQGACPSTVVVQMNWFPQAEHAGLYRLLGANPTVDAGQKRVSAELVASGKDTGVKLEVRSG